MRWLLDILFGKKEHTPKCKHEDVEWRIVEPITLLPKRGLCRKCNKMVKARIVWEDDV